MSSEFDSYVANAIHWAKSQLGSTDYAFLCLAFVEDAYERANSIEIFGGSSAQESADLYGASANLAAFPALGAFVFYRSHGFVEGKRRDWGHVGLSIGDGQVIHAWDKVRIDPYPSVQTLTPAPTWTQPQYIGWSPIERIFEGYRKKSEQSERFRRVRPSNFL